MDVERASVPLLVGSMILLCLLGFARLYDNTRALQGAQRHLSAVERTLVIQETEACELRRSGRENTNVHERIPLRLALAYIASLGLRGEHRGTAAEQAATRAFVARFEGYAAAVQPLPNPGCSAASGGH